MQTHKIFGISLVAVASATVVAVAAWSRADDTTPATTARVDQARIVHAERFELEQPYHHEFRADRPLVRAGWLLVLQADKALLQPRQVKERVLYVGDQTAEPVNSGAESGYRVVLVPKRDDGLELARSPVFFGEPDLPEELRQADIDAALEAARRAGAVPPSAAELAGAGGPRRYPSDYELRLAAIDLVERYSPQEEALISGWRAPLVK